MFPVTCSSVGDILAVVAFIADLAAALKESTGSARKYRSFIRELDAMRVALEAVSRVAQRCADDAIRNAIIEEVKDCCDTVKGAAKCVAKFSPLGRESSKADKNLVRLSRLWYKIEWRVTKREEVEELEARFAASQRRLTTYLAILNKCVLDLS
jgi:hypothetical protein